jgi:GNAT superfamily N-acetyltransferase
MTPTVRPGDPAADGPGFGVIRADHADLEELSQVIADAFFDLPPSQWLIPDPDARREIFPGYFRICVEDAMTAGVVHTTPGRDAAALWLTAGDGTAGPPADYAARLAAVTSPWTDRFVAFDAALDQRHPVGIPHRHLAILAVRPGRQGLGLGTALLRAYHHRLDREVRAPAYLEAADDLTRRLYLRHGYGDLGPPIRLPGGPVMYPMMRKPLPIRTRQPGHAATGGLRAGGLPAPREGASP